MLASDPAVGRESMVHIAVGSLLVAQLVLAIPLDWVEPRAINPVYLPKQETPSLVDVDAPRAINPIYLNATFEEIYKRANSGPLYGSSGKPVMTDIHQTTNPSCGFASSLAAVVNVASEWISSKVLYTGAVGSVSSATVTMYDVDSLAPKEFTISCAETAVHSDIDPATGVWWPGMYDHAAVDLGMANTNGALGPILPSHALQAITGLKATGDTITSADQLFSRVTEAAEKNTPMVLQTKDGGCTKLVCNHAYAIIGGAGTGSGRTVTLYNPWGSKVTNSLADTLAETAYVWYLVNKDTFKSSVSGGVQTSTKPADSTPTSKKPTTTAQDVGVVWVTEVVTVYVTA